MADPPLSTRTARVIRAPPEAIYDAFLDPGALVQWLPPAEMTGRIDSFRPGVGGGYRMTLAYPPTEQRFRGKTTAREDRVNVRFVALSPPRRIVEAVTFDSPDPAFQGEMTLEIAIDPAPAGTAVTLLFADLPPGLRPEDNDTGARLSLRQLAQWLEGGGPGPHVSTSST
jgi:uncharacterized protein YndB with AHSA1/START domain